MPSVSIIIPVYNVEEYLRQCLDSVVNQTLRDIEIICVDDGSTDGSAAILSEYAAKDSRVKVLARDHTNAGAARNAGMAVATGEYFGFVDSDDTIASGAALQQAYEQAKADDLDILLTDSSNMAENGNVTLRETGFVRELLPNASVFEPDALGASLYIVAQGAPWAKFFRRGFLGAKKLRFPPLRRTEDLPFVQMSLSLARRIGVMLVPTINHRMGVATSLESTKDDTPLIFAEADRIFRGSLSRRRLMDRFRCAADVSHLVNIAYCLHMVRRFSSFRAIAQYCAEKFPELNLKGDEVGIRTFHASFKRVSSVAAAANDMNSLAEIFADVQVSKRLRSLRDSSNADLAVKSAEQEQLRGVTTQLKGNIEKQRKAIAAKDTAVAYGGGNDDCSFRGLTEEQSTVLLRANWAIPGGYAIEYDLAGGLTDDAYPVSVSEDGWLELPAPQRDGYEFAGWSLEGEMPDDALFAVPGSDPLELHGAYTYGGGFESCRFYGLADAGGFVRLKAHWTIPGGYAVEYDLNGGTAGSSYPNSFACTGWLYLKTPVKEGFEFAGWSLAGDISALGRYSTQSGVSQLLTSVAAVSYGGGHDYCSFYGLTYECGAVILRANWAVPGGYAVEYDLAGGVATGNYKPSVETTAWMAVPAPQREGYEFAGWTVEGLVSTAARYSVEVNKSNPVVAETPCGAGYTRCSFKALANAGATVRLLANWLIED